MESALGTTPPDRGVAWPTRLHSRLAAQPGPRTRGPGTTTAAAGCPGKDAGGGPELGSSQTLAWGMSQIKKKTKKIYMHYIKIINKLVPLITSLGIRGSGELDGMIDPGRGWGGVIR